MFKKITSAILLLPLQGVSLRRPITQGDALGYVLVAPAGRIAHNYCGSYFYILLNHFLLSTPHIIFSLSEAK